eukprot:7372068-Pyramimonas_sp.AAC.1
MDEADDRASVGGSSELFKRALPPGLQRSSSSIPGANLQRRAHFFEAWLRFLKLARAARQDYDQYVSHVNDLRAHRGDGKVSE